ncbi:acyl-CoA dehydrogenase family protein [uncultured Phenylobacterium sp.]|uniref:acyl-CoA dehydrogenase family protein n=1 Tax=uncultured Phenylobacterium sp. TaxID=349273 RepID=UPI0025DA30B4|nr:acyl-CoA dehydrogenase family protein [uncultured Phenylobacterium sp.]
MSTTSEEALRAEVRSWLEANWDPERELVAWRNLLIDAGWGAPTWPNRWYGRDLSPELAQVVDQEIRRVGAVGVARAGPRSLAQAVLLAHGSDGQKEQFLRRSLTGEDTWCQLFSEPGSGSDPAGATTRADFRDGRWVVSGQKLWTTSAHHADWGLLLARTDWDKLKHQGLSYFLIDMRQPGVEVQPLRQMNGHASFNQVFFTDAEVAADHLVGERGGGWAVATTTLMHERRGFDSFGAGAGPTDVRPGRTHAQASAEAATALEPYVWYPQRTGRVDLVLEGARASGKLDDPVVRQEIAKLLSLAKSVEWTARRARAAQAAGRPPGPEGSLGKLAASLIARAAARVHTQIAGADAMLTGADGPLEGLIAEILVSTPAISIAGGTDEIQRNIIAERVLRMPKEPSPDLDRPFRDVPRSVAT